MDNSAPSPVRSECTTQVRIAAVSALPERPDCLLGRLLSLAFDEQSCLSRYKSSLYRRSSPFPASRHLIERLRNYEAYHKRCGPNSRLFKRSVKDLKSGRNVTDAECKYVIWTPFNGLSNRMLALASTLLYALLTSRALLSNVPEDSEDLFCELFPGSSWRLPTNFPIDDFDNTFTMWAP